MVALAQREHNPAQRCGDGARASRYVHAKASRVRCAPTRRRSWCRGMDSDLRLCRRLAQQGAQGTTVGSSDELSEALRIESVEMLEMLQHPAPQRLYGDT